MGHNFDLAVAGVDEERVPCTLLCAELDRVVTLGKNTWNMAGLLRLLLLLAALQVVTLIILSVVLY